MAWLGLILDVILIAVVAAGVVQAVRLIRQLQDLRTGRVEMERFVRDFNGAILRAEAGISALRTAARESGDDLEKLVEKAGMVRDELNFIVDSADVLADKLSNRMSQVKRSSPSLSSLSPRDPETTQASVERRAGNKPVATPQSKVEKGSISRAEQELIQALKKLG